MGIGNSKSQVKLSGDYSDDYSSVIIPNKIKNISNNEDIQLSLKNIIKNIKELSTERDICKRGSDGKFYSYFKYFWHLLHNFYGLIIIYKPSLENEDIRDISKPDLPNNKELNKLLSSLSTDTEKLREYYCKCLNMSLDNFNKEVNYLRNNNYTVSNISELVDKIKKMDIPPAAGGGNDMWKNFLLY